VVGWTVYQIIKIPVKESINHHRFRAKLKTQKVQYKKVNLAEKAKLYRHIYFLLESVSSSDKKSDSQSINVFNFIIFCCSLGLITMVLLVVKFQDAFLGLIIGSVVSLVPYMYLNVRLKNMRNTVGDQITNIVEILIHSYSAYSNDMYQAIKHTQVNIQEPELRKILVRLISDLQISRNESELRESVDLFIYTCGNSWAMRLGNIILKSYLHQENVLNALLQLQNQMINNQKMLEEEKSESYDAFAEAMLAIILFPAALIGAYYVTRPLSWVSLQFEQKWTFLTFILTTIMTIIAILVGFLIRKPKNDL
jgi:Flp pilus assembly protein TadB